MNKGKRLKTVRPQNDKAAKSFRKKQNMKVELNKKCRDAGNMHPAECHQ